MGICCGKPKDPELLKNPGTTNANLSGTNQLADKEASVSAKAAEPKAAEAKAAAPEAAEPKAAAPQAAEPKAAPPTNPFTAPRVFLKLGCPFCTKFMIFMAEAGLLDKLLIEKDTDENKAYIESAAGKKPTFPCVELEEGKMMFETDDLIAKYAKEGGVDVDKLFALPYYVEGVMRGYMKFWGAFGTEKALSILSSLAEEAKLAEQTTAVRKSIDEEAAPVIDQADSDKAALAKGSPGWKVYLRKGCPFCTAFVVFLAETQLLDTVDVEWDTPENREHIKGIAGKTSFPCMEKKPKAKQESEEPPMMGDMMWSSSDDLNKPAAPEILFETDELINMMAKDNGVDVDLLVVLPYYTNGIMKAFIKFFSEMGPPKALALLAEGVEEPKMAEKTKEVRKSISADVQVSDESDKDANGPTIASFNVRASSGRIEFKLKANTWLNDLDPHHENE